MLGSTDKYDVSLFSGVLRRGHHHLAKLVEVHRAGPVLVKLLKYELLGFCLVRRTKAWESTYYNDGNFTSLPSYIFAPRFGTVNTKKKTMIVTRWAKQSSDVALSHLQDALKLLIGEGSQQL